MRDLLFKGLVIDENGCFQVTGGLLRVRDETTTFAGKDFDIVAHHVPDDDADKGLAPHGYIKLHPPKYDRRKKQHSQLIEVDCLFDVFRPTADSRKRLPDNKKNHYLKKLYPNTPRSALTDAQAEALKAAEKADADNVKQPWQDRRTYDRGKFTDPFLVIHVTGDADIEAQIQQLTTWASIHYIVCWNGHVIKILEDSRGAYHAGWSPSYQEGFRAGWRDYTFGGAYDANRTSIGIEHLAGDDTVWPKEQENGSVRLIRRVCDEHGIPPCSVVRHRDLGVFDEDRAAGKTQRRRFRLHLDGKNCPGESLPWRRFQLEGLTLWPYGLRRGETPTPPPTGTDFFHGIFDIVDRVHGRTRDRRGEHRGTEAGDRRVEGQAEAYRLLDHKGRRVEPDRVRQERQALRGDVPAAVHEAPQACREGRGPGRLRHCEDHLGGLPARPSGTASAVSPVTRPGRSGRTGRTAAGSPRDNSAQLKPRPRAPT